MAVNYPGALDTDTTLHNAVNRAFSTLNGTLAPAAATMTLIDASLFPATGGFVIVQDPGPSQNVEMIKYTGKSGNDLTGLTRGFGNSSDTNHVSGSFVALDLAAEYHERVKEAIIAVQTELGIDPRGSYADVVARLNDAIYTGTQTVKTVRYAADFSGATGDVRIQAAHDDLPASGGTIIAEANAGPDSGVWNLNSPVEFTKPNVILAGQGWNTVLKNNATAVGENGALYINNVNGCMLRDFAMIGGTGDANMISFWNVSDHSLAENILLKDYTTARRGVTINGDGCIVMGCTFDNPSAQAGREAVRVAGSDNVGNRVLSNTFLNPNETSVGLSGCLGAIVKGNAFLQDDGGSQAAVEITGAAVGCIVEGNYFQCDGAGGATGITIQDTALRCIVSENVAVELNSGVVGFTIGGDEMIVSDNLGPDGTINISASSDGTHLRGNKMSVIASTGTNMQQFGNSDWSTGGTNAPIITGTQSYGSGDERVVVSSLVTDHPILLYPDRLTWDDVRAPATAINPPGIVSDPDFDSTNVGWLFDNNSTEVLMVVLQLPHKYAEGTDITPHIHWEPTNTDTGDVYWRLEYDWYNVNTARAGFTTINIQDAGSGTADRQQIASFGAITGTGKLLSSLFVCKVSRIGGDVLDTYNADARLMEFDIHFQTNTLGSRQATSK